MSWQLFTKNNLPVSPKKWIVWIYFPTTNKIMQKTRLVFPSKHAKKKNYFIFFKSNPVNQPMQKNMQERSCHMQLSSAVWNKHKNLLIHKLEYMDPITVLSKGKYEAAAAISLLKQDLALDFLYLILFWTETVIQRKVFFQRNPKLLCQ